MRSRRLFDCADAPKFSLGRLFVMCILFMILSVVDMVRRKKPIKGLFVRVQQLREGSIIVVNALFLL